VIKFGWKTEVLLNQHQCILIAKLVNATKPSSPGEWVLEMLPKPKRYECAHVAVIIFPLFNVVFVLSDVLC